MSVENFDSVQEELSRLRWDVGRIDAVLLRAPQHAASPEPASSPVLRVFFERVAGERRPFVVRFEGRITETLRLSGVRAAIVLTLFLDLEDRASGGRGVLDPVHTILDAYRQFDAEGETDADKIANRVRAALYRFSEFVGEHLLLPDKSPLLCFDPHSNRLRSALVDGALPTVEVSASDAKISGLIDSILATSPLSRVRKYKAVFMPSGQEGYDRFLLELVDHSYPVTIKSMFIRPGLHNYPESILRKLRSSGNRLRRRELVRAGFAHGSCRHTEFLQRSVLWDLIRVLPSGEFVSYPAPINRDDIVEHLETIIETIRRFPNYELVITQAPSPFTLVSFALHSAAIPEYFTLLYQHYSRECLYDIGAFALSDCNVHSAITARVFDWALESPTTIRSRDQVLHELVSIKNYFLENGPLPEHAPIPLSLASS